MWMLQRTQDVFASLFLHDMVCSIMRTEVVGFSTSVGSSWIFLIVLESTYEGGVKSALGVGYALYDLISVYGFLPKDLWIFPG